MMTWQVAWDGVLEQVALFSPRHVAPHLPSQHPDAVDETELAASVGVADDVATGGNDVRPEQRQQLVVNVDKVSML
jgi:hypothetical protein